MKRRLTPQEKKAYAYQKEHFDTAEYPHAFRRSWPKKKAQAKRAYRHKVKQSLDSAVTQYTDDIDAQTRVTEIARKNVRKWPTLTLRGWLEERQSRRAFKFARDLLSESYDTEKHREHFLNLLSTLPTTSQFYGPALARGLALLLQGAWLRDFLCAEPEWEARLRDWIDEQDLRNGTDSYAIWHNPSVRERVRR